MRHTQTDTTSLSSAWLNSVMLFIGNPGTSDLIFVTLSMSCDILAVNILENEL